MFLPVKASVSNVDVLSLDQCMITTVHTDMIIEEHHHHEENRQEEEDYPIGTVLLAEHVIVLDRNQNVLNVALPILLHRHVRMHHQGTHIILHHPVILMLQEILMLILHHLEILMAILLHLVILTQIILMHHRVILHVVHQHPHCLRIFAEVTGFVLNVENIVLLQKISVSVVMPKNLDHAVVIKGEKVIGIVQNVVQLVALDPKVLVLNVEKPSQRRREDQKC